MSQDNVGRRARCLPRPRRGRRRVRWDLGDLGHASVRGTEGRDLGHSVLWLGRVHMRGGASQVELDQEFANHVEVRDGKIARAQAFLSWQDGLEAAGLRE
jgi:ketosteroid isomerase-like protein